MKFAAALEPHRRRPMVRAWAAGKSRPWIETFPKGVTYFLKYSLFDVVDCEPDPAIHEWVAAGHDVVATPEIQGGENGGPTLWRRPGYLPGIVEKSLAAGASGVVACVNSEHGFLSTPLRVQQSPIALFAHAVAGGGDDRDLSVACDRRIFGAAGERVHGALEACSEITFALPRVVFEPDEGFTWQFAYHVFEDDWPGRIGGAIDAEPWIAGDLASLKTWLAAARRTPLTEPFSTDALGGRGDPLEFVKQAARRAVDGERDLLAVEDSIPEAARADFALAKTSARLCVLLGEEWVALLSAVLYLEAGSNTQDVDARAALAARCLAAFDATIAAIDATSEAAKTFPDGIVGDGLVQRLPRKREQRVEERAEAARRLAAAKGS